MTLVAGQQLKLLIYFFKISNYGDIIFFFKFQSEYSCVLRIVAVAMLTASVLKKAFIFALWLNSLGYICSFPGFVFLSLKLLYVVFGLITLVLYLNCWELTFQFTAKCFFL